MRFQPWVIGVAVLAIAAAFSFAIMVTMTLQAPRRELLPPVQKASPQNRR